MWGEELALFAGLRLLPAVQRVVGRPLRLVYAFSIAYAAGGDLKPHRDRPQNAFSVSLNLGLLGGGSEDGTNEGDEVVEDEDGDEEDDDVEGALEPGADAPEPWPLWVVPVGARNDSAAVAARLRPNDALLYQGPLSTHFREPLGAGLASMQVIFGFRDVDPLHCNSQ